MTDFTVRYCHFDKDILAVLALADLFQIPCKEQEVPEIVLGGILIIIGDIDIRREISVMSDIPHLQAENRIGIFIYG